MSITQTELSKLVSNLVSLYKGNDLNAFRKLMSEAVLKNNVLPSHGEYVGRSLYQELGSRSAIQITNSIAATKLDPAYYVASAILKEHLEKDPDYVFFKAREYILWGNNAFPTGIISESVFAWGLIKKYENTMLHMPLHQKHPNIWIRCSVGIAIHSAINLGIGEEKVQDLFELCKHQFYATEEEVKESVVNGFDAISQHYPHLITAWLKLEDNPYIPDWVQKKIR